MERGITLSCLNCGQGLHKACGDPCCGQTSVCPQRESRIDDLVVEKEIKKVGRPPKADDEVMDPYSTGRRRAQALFPIEPEGPCEWQGQADVGGGLYPVVGCLTGKQEETHHGPNKDTMCNEEENVHRICRRCHRLWHAWNDGCYNPEIYAREELKHEPREGTREELRKWSTSKTRPKPPILRAGSFQRMNSHDNTNNGREAEN